jgi:hypothetical protein
MTVRELIEQLQQYDENQEVRFIDSEHVFDGHGNYCTCDINGTFINNNGIVVIDGEPC